MSEESKLKSRKFVVWVTWLILVLIYTVLLGVIIFVKKMVPDNLLDMGKMIIQYFFAVSMLYLGVNVVQKGVVVAADALQNIKTIEKEVKEPDTETATEGEK